MKGNKFLSDVLDASIFRSNTMNIVEAPCGCGKTTASINFCATLAQNPRRALILIDTNMGNFQLAKNDALTLPYIFFEETAGRDGKIGMPLDDGIPLDKVVVTTYAQFGVYVSRQKNFIDNFDVIVCDEAHNLVKYSKMKNTGTNYAAIAREANPVCHAYVTRKMYTQIGMNLTA